MYREKVLDEFIEQFKDTDEDFFAIYWHNPLNNQQSLVRFILQDKRKPKKKEFDSETQKAHYYWPGVNAPKAIAVIKSYAKSQRYSDCFHCVYRINHTEGLEDKLKELIPEANREAI